MNTVVIQSTKKFEVVPKTTQACLDSAKNAAKSLGYDYQFLNDELFNYAGGFQLRLIGLPSKLPLTDYARNQWTHDLLMSGKYDRVIWVDADIYIKDPSVLINGAPWSLSAERWMRWDKGQIVGSSRLGYNNSIQMYTTAAIDMLRSIMGLQESTSKYFTSVSHDMLGTRLFKSLSAIVSIPVFDDHVIVDQNLITSDAPDLSTSLAKQYGFSSIKSANLCFSEVDKAVNDKKIIVTDEMYLDYLTRI